MFYYTVVVELCNFLMYFEFDVHTQLTI